MTTANRIIKYLTEHPYSDSVDLSVGLAGVPIAYIMQELARLADAGVIERKGSGVRSWYRVQDAIAPPATTP